MRTIRKVMGGGGGGGGAKAKIKIEQGNRKKKFVHQKCLKKNSCRDFSIWKIISCQGLSEVQCKESKRKIILNFIYISNGVRKIFHNLIGAKKRFNHVSRRFFKGKCVLNLN